MNITTRALPVVAVLAILSLRPAMADGPKDCTAAPSNVDMAVCSDDTLSAADAQMQVLIEKAGGEKVVLTPTQDDWRSQVRDPCPDTECLAKVYLDRIAAIQNQIAVAEKPAADKRAAEYREQYKAAENAALDQQSHEILVRNTPTPEQQTERDEVLWMILGGIMLYFLPTIIAFGRGHEHRWAILLANTLGGITVIGWFIALALACRKISGTTAVALAALEEERRFHRGR